MPVVDLTVDSSGATKGLKQYDTAVDKSGKSTDKLSAALTKVKGNFALMAAAAATAAAAAGAAFAVMAVKAASDMEETQGKFDVVFRNLGTYAEDAAERIADSYGQSEQQTKQFLSSLQDLLVPTGLARDEAAKMSVAFAELAADLGSFNNMPTATVIRDIQSALAGGSETMTKYGIDVKVAAVNAEIMALGLDTSTAAAERQSRAVALLSIAQRDSADAIGDFNRTQDSLANQLKTTKGLIDDFAAGVGEALLPHVTAVVTAINDWLKKGDNFEKMIDTTSKIILYMAEGAVKAAQGLALVATAVGVLFGGLLNLLTPMELFLDGLIALGAIDSNPITKMKDAVDTFTEAAKSGYEAMSEAAKKLSESIDNVGKESEETKEQVDGLTDSVLKLAEANETGSASFAELDAMAAETATIVAQADTDLKNFNESMKQTGDTTKQAMSETAVPAEKEMTAATQEATVAIQQQADGLDEMSESADGAAESLATVTGNTIEMSNSFTSSGDDAEDLRAKLVAIKEMQDLIDASNENIFGSIGGPWSAFTNADLSGYAAQTSYSLSGGGGSNSGTTQEADLISEFIAAGGDITQIYITESVSRSDIASIATELTRTAERA